MTVPGIPRAAVVIPSRYGSTRFPGKPLALIAGKPMIRHVHDAARGAKLASRVVVATDDARIADAVRAFGGEVAMTSPECASGTDRVAEVARTLEEDVYLNLQGDEPLMNPAVIDAVIAPLFADRSVVMTTAALPMDDMARFSDPMVVKVVVDDRGDALYFSRAPIPHDREGRPVRWRKHLGIYGYRKDFLLRLASMPPSSLEATEMLEQLRVLQAGYKIRVVDVALDSVGVDTPEDLKNVEDRLCARDAR
ncbi:MAG TPA: 3-deoxy-manno-octulosonate cytidylyltransferase [Candidatus Deferrimicrobiaceae bacterium]